MYLLLVPPFGLMSERRNLMQWRITARAAGNMFLLLAFLLPVVFCSNYFIAEAKDKDVPDLIRAIRDKENKKANKLIERNRDINTQDAYGWTPLMYAVFREDKVLVEKLLSHGANPNLADQDGTTPLIAAIIRMPELFMLQYLPESAKSPILIASMLVEKGADPNIADREGNSPLIYATIRNQETAVAALIRKGANPNQADRYGRTPLFFVNNPGHASGWAPSDCKLASHFRARRIPADESQWEPDYAAQVKAAREQANITLEQIKERIAKLLQAVGATDAEPGTIQAPDPLIDTPPLKLKGMEELNRVSMNFSRNERMNGSYSYNILICVATDGTVKEAVVLSGMPYGASEALKKAAMKLKYRPAMKNGQPVEFWDRFVGVAAGFTRSSNGFGMIF